MAVDSNDTLDIPTLASMIDLAAVQANSTKTNVQNLADLALKYDCKAVFVLSGFLPFLADYRRSHNGPFLMGGTVGFPSGGTNRAMKEHEAKSVVALGADEVDMMINVGFLLSGMDREAEEEIRAVKDTIGSIPLKVIIECHYLTEDLICKACELTANGGAQWVKTGTGWAPTGATLENVALIKKTVGHSLKIKASGGVKNLETIKAMIHLGVERFGLGGSAQKIFDELMDLQKTHESGDQAWTMASNVDADFTN